MVTLITVLLWIVDAVVAAFNEGRTRAVAVGYIAAALAFFGGSFCLSVAVVVASFGWCQNPPSGLGVIRATLKGVGVLLPALVASTIFF